MTLTPSAEALALAERALDEIAPKGAVGEVAAAEAVTEGVIALQYRSLLPGYPDWHWTVLVSECVEGGPTVLEATLLPSEASLVAPEWVPWADRLAEYMAAREAEASDGAEASDEKHTDDDDDFDDFDEDDLAGDLTDDDVVDAVFADGDDDGDDEGHEGGDAEGEAEVEGDPEADDGLIDVETTESSL